MPNEFKIFKHENNLQFAVVGNGDEVCVVHIYKVVIFDGGREPTRPTCHTDGVGVKK